MDQHERIERLKGEVAEQFLQRVIAFETAPMITDFAQLASDGVELPDPATVSDHDIGVVLWRVIAALARHRVFLERTNHLSDRELYSVLWQTVLREVHAALPAGDTGAWHVDVPGDDAEATNYLTYYAGESERQRFRQDRPGVTLPPHREPGFDRDAALPVPGQ